MRPPGDSESTRLRAGARRGAGWRDFLRRRTASPTPVPGSERREGADRRRRSLWALTYGSFRPRRRSGRREGDLEQVFLDWHEPRVLYLALTIVLLSCADALFTLNLLQLGATEANVLMHTLITHDVDRFIAVKIGATCVGVIFLGLAARRHILGVVPVIRVLQAFCLGYGLLIAYELGLFLLFFGESPLAHAADVLPGWLQ